MIAEWTYRLDGRVPVHCSWDEYVLQMMENSGLPHIADTERSGVRVSTIFLGLDHGFGFGPPRLFETMIFGGVHDLEQWRYSTFEEALAGHMRAVDLVSVAADLTEKLLYGPAAD